MPQRKPTFNWSLLDRKDLIKFLYLIHPEVSEKRISVAAFQKILSKHLKSKLPITVSKKLDKFTETGSVYVGGTYYSDYDKKHRRCIEISFFYNLDQKYLKLSKRGFYGICILATDTILHEIMHMRQYRRRNFKFLPDEDTFVGHSLQGLFGIDRGFSLSRLVLMLLYILVIYLLFFKNRARTIKKS